MKYFYLTIFLAAVISSLSAQTQKDAHNFTFMVFSDPHYYDPSLGTEGNAFEQYLEHDRKLLKEGPEILSEVLSMIKTEHPDFVIIPGDLTKDGTEVSHQKFAEHITELLGQGIPVYVVPGNHDILNGESRSFQGDSSVLVQNINPKSFAEIYKKMGYDAAIYRDTASLSYIAEPVPGTWLFALDACLYKENVPGHHPVTDGQFSPETLQWIKEMATLAGKENKQIIAFMHHGVAEHYASQQRNFGEYIVNDYRKVQKIFTSQGLHFVFTGHYHAQDITKVTLHNGNFLFDIETGSLVTYPCPVRTIKIRGDSMIIRSDFIESIPSHPDNFVEYSKQYVHDGISGIAERTMINMKLRPEDAAKLAGQIGDAFVAHYRGDEPPVEKCLDLKGVGLLGRIMILFKKRMVTDMHHDLPPADNDIVILMKSGEVVK